MSSHHSEGVPITSTSQGSEVRRLFFKEVLPGDLRKFRAESNDSQTGGGARDFRIRAYEEFKEFFGRLLPNRGTIARIREGVPRSVVVFSAQVHIFTGGEPIVSELKFEPPTSARPNEGRLTRVSDLPLQVPEGEGRVFLVIFQTYSHQVWLSFATEQQLRANEWHPKVSAFLKSCLEMERAANRAAQGYIDFVDGEEHCV